METKEELTQPVFEEEWGVQVGKEAYTLNEKQIKLLKEADLSGQRGIVWFDRLAISIPHIQSVWLISRRIKNQLPEGTTPDEPIRSEQERERISKKIQEMKEKLMIKLEKRRAQKKK